MPIVNGSAPAQQVASLPSAPGIMPGQALPTQIMPAPVVEPVGTPSECLLLKNMFDPATEVCYQLIKFFTCAVSLNQILISNYDAVGTRF